MYLECPCKRTKNRCICVQIKYYFEYLSTIMFVEQIYIRIKLQILLLLVLAIAILVVGTLVTLTFLIRATQCSNVEVMLTMVATQVCLHSTTIQVQLTPSVAFVQQLLIQNHSTNITQYLSIKLNNIKWILLFLWYPFLKIISKTY